jgi:hypothetical protein
MQSPARDAEVLFSTTWRFPPEKIRPAPALTGRGAGHAGLRPASLRSSSLRLVLPKRSGFVFASFNKASVLRIRIRFD